MCEEFNVKLLTKIPIEPELMKSCDQGKCYVKECPKSITANSFLSIYEEVKKVMNL
jgi:MinD superfamily P-loop ATPase